MLNLVKGGTEKKKMISKKAQQEIIVTVLLVLIALAAVAAVATFALKNIKTSTASGEDKQACLRLELAITAAPAGGNVTIARSGLGTDILNNVTVAINGVITNATQADLTAGTSKTLNIPGSLVKKSKVDITPVLADGYVCPIAATTTVV